MAGTGGTTVNFEPISKEAAECWGVGAVTAQQVAQSPVTGAYAAILALIGTVGLIRQWDALDRSLDIAEEGVDIARDYYELAERNYDEITLDAYNCQKSLFNRYVDDFADCVEAFIEKGKEPQEYEPDYALYEARATAGVGEQFTRLRNIRQKQRSKYAVGQCCAEELQLQIAQATALNDARNRGYRYEDERRFRYDQWYWSKCEGVANFVATMRAHVISGVNSGVANATGALGALGSAVNSFTNAANSQSGALQDTASFFGSVSNGAFQLAGGALGFNSFGANVPNMLGPANPSVGGLLGGGGSSFISPGAPMNATGLGSGFNQSGAGFATGLGNSFGFDGSLY